MTLSSIIVISPGFPVDENDSTCLPSQQLFVRSVNKIFPAIKITVISLQHPAHQNQYRWFGNVVIPLDGKRYPRILKPLFWRTATSKVAKVAEQERAEAIISFWCQETALIGTRVSERLNISHKIWICGQDARKQNVWVRLMNLKANDLVAMSDFLSGEFAKNHKIRPAHIIPNGIEISSHRNSIAAKSIDIIGVGSLTSLKQYTAFIEAIDIIKKVRSDVKAVIVGDGPERLKLEELIVAKNLSTNMELAGELPHDQVLGMLERSKILLHPSSYEGYSTVCLEGLYSGCHVISFTFAENRKIKHWHVVNSTTAMADKALRIMNDDPVPERVVLHTMDETAHAFMNLFERMK